MSRAFSSKLSRCHSAHSHHQHRSLHRPPRRLRLMRGTRKMQTKTSSGTIPSLSSQRQGAMQTVLADGLIDALGRIVTDKQREFETELQKAIEREVRTV